MSVEFPELNHLILALSPARRRVLARNLNIDLRKKTSEDILKNIDPDGHPMESRRAGKGRKPKKGKMFQKLGLRKSMRMSSTADVARITFLKKNERIARVHHWGLTSEVNKLGHRVKYPVRRLLGFNPVKQKIVEDIVLKHLSGGTK